MATQSRPYPINQGSWRTYANDSGTYPIKVMAVTGFTHNNTHEDVADVVAFEVSGSGYARATLTSIAWQTTGTLSQLLAASPVFASCTVTNVDGFVFFADMGADSASPLIASVTIPPTTFTTETITVALPGGVLAQIAPADPEITSVAGITPDTAGDIPVADLATALDIELGNGVPIPVEANAAEFATGVWTITIPDIDGTTYIVPDYASPDDHGLFPTIPALGVPGLFTLVVLPQTGAGLLTTLVVASGGSAEGITVGNGLPTDLTDGVVFEFRCDGVNDWTVSTPTYTPDGDDFIFKTAVSRLRSHMYVGAAHDGLGATDYIDQARTGDDPGFYMATDNAALLEPNGTAFPASGAAMIALRNQAAGSGEGKTGFYHARRMPVGLTFTIFTPLGDITVTPANYASPQPVAGDVCLVNGLTIDGQWQDSNIQAGEDVAVGNTRTWRTTGSGMFTDFEDISPSAGSGDLVSTNNLSDVANAATARTNLGLAIGTNVQAYDAELAALAGLTSAADKGIQFTGSGTAATYDLTTAGKALLDDADATAQRATLGLVLGTNVETMTWAPRPVYKSSDETISSDNTLSDDSTLLYAIGASETWHIDAELIYTSGSTPDFQVAVTGPSGATCELSVFGPTTTDAAIPHPYRTLNSYQALATTTAVGGLASSVRGMVHIRGTIFNSTNAGNVTIQWAQNTSDASNTVVRKGSTLLMRRLA